MNLNTVLKMGPAYPTTQASGPEAQCRTDCHPLSMHPMHWEDSFLLGHSDYFFLDVVVLCSVLFSPVSVCCFVRQVPFSGVLLVALCIWPQIGRVHKFFWVVLALSLSCAFSSSVCFSSSLVAFASITLSSHVSWWVCVWFPPSSDPSLFALSHVVCSHYATVC